MTLPEINNYYEIVLWTTVGIVLLFKSRKSVIKSKRLGLVSASAFFVFALSDFIEIQTGAWWDPWWLLLLKGSCLGVMGVAFIRYRSMKRVDEDERAGIREGMAGIDR